MAFGDQEFGGSNTGMMGFVTDDKFRKLRKLEAQIRRKTVAADVAYHAQIHAEFGEAVRLAIRPLIAYRLKKTFSYLTGATHAL